MKQTFTKFVFSFLLVISLTVTTHCSNNGITNDNTKGIQRSEIILIADQFARVHWYMSEENIHAGGCATNNNFTSDYPVGPRIGVGYKWSGWEDVEVFLQKIYDGYGTGTGGYVTYERMEISPDCFTGVSCTGLVSKTWRLEKKYTLNYGPTVDAPQFSELTTEISYDELKKGDALINAEHIMLYAYTNRDGVIMVFDSAIRGVSFRSIPWSYLNSKNTIPIKFNYVTENDNEQGTIANPFMIDFTDGQFTHAGNTRNVVSMEFDTYSITPENNETGPECIYQLNINSNVSLNISIIDIKDEGIDNNIYLLTSLDAENYTTNNCIAWGDNNINIQLSEGTYFIVVDSGNNLPGEYVLTIE